MIVSVDPGVRFTGIAVWDHHNGRYFLRRAHLVKNTAKELAISVAMMADEAFIGHHKFEGIVVELPQVYDRAHSVADPNDLIAVAAVAGAVMGAYTRCADEKTKMEFVLPKVWKGQAKKGVTKNRVLVDLKRREMENVMLVKSAKQNENIYDAIGIGLWYLRRAKLRSASPERSMAGMSEAHVN